MWQFYFSRTESGVCTYQQQHSSFLSTHIPHTLTEHVTDIVIDDVSVTMYELDENYKTILAHWNEDLHIFQLINKI